MEYQTFKESYQLRLNPQQEAAVLHTEGPVLLLAVPGSGKTTVLVARLGYLLLVRGVPPENILTVTYTVAATQDMKRLFAAAFGQQLADKLSFRTINSLCASVIAQYAQVKNRDPFSLESNDGRLNKILRELFLSIEGEHATDLQIKELRTQITYCKNMMFTEEELRNQLVDGMDFPALYTAYQHYMVQNQKMDFDDQMVFAWRILRRHGDILSYFQQRYRYFCVDEAQDTSKIQHCLIRLLAASNNIFMVGDEDQSIYGFRAAWPQALLEFEKDYPNAQVLLMESNYRSTPSIVAGANRIIQRNQNRHQKVMQATQPVGEAIQRVVLADYSEQYRYILEIARNCTSSTAVLFRNNDSALPIINLLEREGIAYSCRQREGLFFSNPVVRDLLDILQFSLQDTDWDAFLRFYYKLDFKVKKSLLLLIQEQNPVGGSVWAALLKTGDLTARQRDRMRALKAQFSTLSSCSSFLAIQQIVREMGYGNYIHEQKQGEASRVQVMLALAEQTSDLVAFLARMQQLKQLVENGSTHLKTPFVLSTIHASKGLEYDRVVLIDVIDGLLPRITEPTDGRKISPEEQDAIEEERRVFYVGVTRARQQLTVLSYTKLFGESKGCSSSFAQQLVDEPKSVAIQPIAATNRNSSHTKEEAQLLEQFKPERIILHKSFGQGILVNRMGAIATIDFQTGGIKKLDLSHCLQKKIVSFIEL